MHRNGRSASPRPARWLRERAVRGPATGPGTIDGETDRRRPPALTKISAADSDYYFQTKTWPSQTGKVD